MEVQQIRELILKELPKMIRQDNALREWVLNISSAQFADKVETESRFDQMMRIIQRKIDEDRQAREEQQREWQKQAQKWEEDQRKWDENQRKWDENQRKWDENQRKWDENQRKWDENQQKWEAMKRESDERWAESQQKWEAMQRESDERKAESQQKWEAMKRESDEHKAESQRKWEEGQRRWEAMQRESDERKAESQRKWEEGQRRWEAMKRESDERWAESQQKWEAMQRESDERKAESQRKWEEGQRRWEAMKRESDERWAEGQRKWEANQKVINEMLESIRKLDKKYDQTIGALGTRWGLHSEEAFRNALSGILREFPSGVEVVHVNEFDDVGEVFGRPDQIELDLIIRNGTLLIAEIKSSVSRGEMYLFERKARFYERKHQRTAHKLIVISPMVDKRAKEVAAKLGITIYSYTDEVEFA